MVLVGEKKRGGWREGGRIFDVLLLESSRKKL